MKMIATAVLFFVAALAAVLAILATLPLLPGYLEEGAPRPPMDATEVYAAAERLRRAGGGLLLAAWTMYQAPSALVAPLALVACAALAYTGYLSVDVVPIVVFWARHVRGEHAVSYRLALAGPFLPLLVVGVLWLLMVIAKRAAAVSEAAAAVHV